MADGRLFSQEEIEGAGKVALVGQTVVASLFGDSDPLGLVIRIKNVPFTVIGVLERKGQTTFGQDQDDTVLIPLSTAKKKVLGASQANARSVGSIAVKVREARAMGEAEQEIRGLLRQRHRLQTFQDDDFNIRNLTEVLQSQEASSRVLTLLLAAIASVSLLVGGIGIMNIMLATVSERTREIGIRRALGAKRRDIIEQFLIETTVMSGSGGLIGVVLGLAVPPVVARLSGIPVVISPWSPIVAFLIAVLTGVIFGVYPARRAALLDPVEALRSE